MNLNRNPKPGHFGWVWMAACCLLLGCELQDKARDKTQDKESLDRGGRVGIVIDYNGRKPNQEFELSVRDDATVLSILQQAQQANGIEFDFRGDGNTAFVTAIGGVQNEKAVGDNWNYRVNGQLGDRSCGLFSIKTGDQILWMFGKYP